MSSYDYCEFKIENDTSFNNVVEIQGYCSQYINLIRKASIMATSEAQKRASAKYRKNNVKAIMFNLYPSDSDLIEFLEGKENRSSYIKELIRKDMNNSKN